MFHSSRSSTRRERELKGDWKRQIFIETVRQEAQPQLKQTEITAVGALQDRYPVILLGDAAQIHDPQIGQTGRQQQAEHARRLGQMAFVDLKAATFLVGKEGFDPE